MNSNLVDSLATDPFSAINLTSFLEARGLDKSNAVPTSGTMDVRDPVGSHIIGQAWAGFTLRRSGCLCQSARMDS